MILTALSDSTRIVEYEWTINGIIQAETTKSITADVESPDFVSVIGKNDCGNWSERIYLKWEEKDYNMILVALAIILLILILR